jgi:hypothetical protein
MKPSLAMIGLWTEALSDEKGEPQLDYYFENYSQCEAERKAKNSSAF